MIPESFIESWRSHAKWQTLSMVEQDLIISRALVSLYNNPKIKDSLVFRGDTALHKLFVKPPARYSEDIDFVQTKAEPIGLTIEAIRASLKPWLGNPKWKLTERSAKARCIFQLGHCLKYSPGLQLSLLVIEKLISSEPLVWYVPVDAQ